MTQEEKDTLIQEIEEEDKWDILKKETSRKHCKACRKNTQKCKPL